jgi:hypothetical protein
MSADNMPGEFSACAGVQSGTGPPAAGSISAVLSICGQISRSCARCAARLPGIRVGLTPGQAAARRRGAPWDTSVPPGQYRGLFFDGS